jgi:hypothetical protein
MAKTFKLGDRIAYTRAFLDSLGGRYDIAQRRGTFMTEDGTLARVIWDDYSTQVYWSHAGLWGEDFADDEFVNGSAVMLGSICKIRSLAFIEAHYV